MVKRLRAKNFRSIKELDLEPGRNNVLVGPNAAGKSNILDVLRFLNNLAFVGVNKALMSRNGYNQVTWKGRDPGAINLILNLQISVEPGGVRDAEYEIKIDGTPTDLITVKRERLTFGEGGEAVHLIDLAMGHGGIRHADGTKAFDAPGNPAQSALEYNVPKWEG